MRSFARISLEVWLVMMPVPEPGPGAVAAGGDAPVSGGGADWENAGVDARRVSAARPAIRGFIVISPFLV
jgi:hypothetical protein